MYDTFPKIQEREKMMNVLILYVALGIISALLALHIGLSKSSFKTWHPMLKQGRRRILILTAHPDDECMFFSPVIMRLSKRHDLFLLCLSNGNADGLGKIRAKELIASGKVLGIRPDRIQSKDDPQLPDSMSIMWDPTVITSLVKNTVEKELIDMIITFDEYGISGHANHRSLHDAMKKAKTTNEISIPVYKLVSFSILRKFSSIFDILFTSFNFSMRPPNSTRMIFVSSFRDYLRGRKAMFKHVSQLVWFRHLYLLFSRYMILNDLEEITT